MMYDSLFDRFNRVYPLKPEIKQRLEEIFELVEYPRHHLLLKEGDVCNYMWIVIKGLVRVYYNKNDEEITSRLMAENFFITAYMSYFSRSESVEFLEVYEDSILVRVSVENIQQLFLDFPEFNYTARVLTEFSFFLAEKRTLALRKTSADERVQFFIDEHGDLLTRVASRHIASYLGIDESTYSRVKRKLLHKS
jgi:CRP/FNR family transcriptional regulator, anaerobic regulatory protein